MKLQPSKHDDTYASLANRSAVFHRDLIAPVGREAVGGDGIYVIDRQGKRYIDGSSGSGVSCVGHSNCAVREAMREQVDTLAYAHTAFFTNKPMEELAANLVQDAPEGLGHVWFTSSGAEATEAALKLTRQFFIDSGQPDRQVIIGRSGGYLGSSLAALSAGGNAARKEPFAPFLPTNVRHIGPAYAYRGLGQGETLEAYARRTAAELEMAIQEAGPTNVAAFVAETVVGSTLGAVAAPPGYFKHIREICDRHGVLLILDEVMCGMGRTGSRYACDLDEVAPDILMLGKSLAGGYAPLGAVLVSQTVYSAIKLGTGFFRHGHSFHGHALSCATGLAVQREIQKRGLIPRAVRMGATLEKLLHDRLSDHPNVGDIRGKGLMRGIELVADKVSKRPFDTKRGLHSEISARAMELGLICYALRASPDSGDHVMLMPPLIVESQHLEEIVDKLAIAIEQATRTI